VIDDQPSGKGVPVGVVRRPEHPARGGDGAGREDDQTAPGAQQRSRRTAGAGARRDRLAGAGEIDRQNVIADLRHAAKRAHCHDLEIGAHAGDQMADDQAVDDAERVVGDHDQGPPPGHRSKPALAVADRDAQASHGQRPDVVARPQAPARLLIGPNDPLTAAEALDQPDHGLPGRAVLGRGIADHRPARPLTREHRRSPVQASGG
jgi:hypothetical protein